MYMKDTKAIQIFLTFLMNCNSVYTTIKFNKICITYFDQLFSITFQYQTLPIIKVRNITFYEVWTFQKVFSIFVRNVSNTNTPLSYVLHVGVKYVMRFTKIRVKKAQHDGYAMMICNFFQEAT